MNDYDLADAFIDAYFPNGTSPEFEAGRKDVIEMLVEFKKKYIPNFGMTVCENCGELSEKVSMGYICEKCFCE
jgi:hypothetical protein